MPAVPTNSGQFLISWTVSQAARPRTSRPRHFACVSAFLIVICTLRRNDPIQKLICCFVVLILCVPITGTPQSRAPVVQSVDIRIPVPPVPVRLGGKPHLAYEIHLTNFRPFDAALTRIQVLDAERNVSIGDFQDAELMRRLGHPGISGELKDARIVPPGRNIVLYLWLPLNDDRNIPVQLQHRIELDWIKSSGNEHVVIPDYRLEVRKEKPVALDPPLRGGPWVGLYDPMMARGHRTSIYTINGRARIPARFAIDWILLDDHSKQTREDASKIANWHGYGADVLAVADSTVVDAMDDIPEGPMIQDSPAPVPLENASGNYVALDLGNGKYAFYEHLKHGSVRVKKGERVKSGQVIAQLGNSGSSSSGPHLHFHVSNAISPLAAEGEPYEFKQFEVIGEFNAIDSLGKGEQWKSASENLSGKRTMELPAPNVVVRFP